MYILVFAAALRLRCTQPDAPRPYKVPGGKAGLWIVAGMGLAGSVFGLVIGFIPPAGLEHWPTPIYVAAMAVGIGICSLPPFIIARIKKPEWNISKSGLAFGAGRLTWSWRAGRHIRGGLRGALRENADGAGSRRLYARPMSNPTVLVLYASKHGQTAKIADRIATVLRERDVDVTLRRATDGTDASPAGFDGCVVAASVHAGHHQHEIVEYARAHFTSLSDRPSAFVSVSLTAADVTDESRTATRELIDDFLDDTGWTTDTTLPVAGALQYQEYDFVTRLVMRLTASRHGTYADTGGDHDFTDTKHDHEFTDWEALDRFASAFASTLIQQPSTN